MAALFVFANTPRSKMLKGEEMPKTEVRCENKCSQILKKEQWENTTCTVCMEYPHKAVLLLCSSHNNGCHPFMCGTSYLYSNCLDQYKKSCAKLAELSCPLCRGKVTGWTLIESAREFFNAKKRNCMQDECSFTGTYKELRKHMRMVHPSIGPRVVDPVIEQKWRRLAHEMEQNDVMNVVRPVVPGGRIVEDYVIDADYSEGNTSNWDAFNSFLQERDIEAFGNVSLEARLRRIEGGRHQNRERVVLSRAGTRRRRREMSRQPP